MKPLRAVFGKELLWHRTQLFRAQYELRAGDDAVARMEYLRFAGRIANVNIDEHCWQMRPKGGPFSSEVQIFECGTEHSVAHYVGRLWTGSLERNGRHYRFSRIGPFGMHVRIDSPEGFELMRTHAVVSLGSTSGRVELHPAASAEAELPLLIGLSWHLVVTRRRAAAAAA